MTSPAQGAALEWLPVAAVELSRHEADATAFSNQAVALAVRLAKGGVRPAAGVLEPIYAAFDRHLARPITAINLGDFARLAQAVQQLWVASGRDMALRPVTEQIATRFGLIAGALKAPLPAFDALFDQVFGPAFKTAARWEETMALLRTRMLDPYFAYLERVYPRGNRPAQVVAPGNRPLRIGYLCWSYECGGSFAIGRVLHSILHGHALLGGAESQPFLYAQTRCAPETEALFRGLPGLTIRDFSTLRDPEAVAAAIAADRLDALVVEGFNAFAFRVSQAHATPVQLYMPLGLHPLAAPFYDGYLIYENFGEAPYALGLPRERTGILPWMLDPLFLNPPRAAEQIAAARAQLPPGTPVFACICRMEKVSESYMETMARVLEAAPDAGLLVAGPNDRMRVKAFFEARGLSARVRVLGSVDAHTFHNAVDVFTDTFPIFGGLAPIEAMAKGVPAIYMEEPGVSGSDDLRDPALKATDPESYFRIALRLATEPAYLAERRIAAKAVAVSRTDVAATARVICDHARAMARMP
ncbi:MAG TPA: glycosyltransferase [Dongiaceae bacterium]|nr:glycosyltransferase [Dongiaceae bacterium]